MNEIPMFWDHKKQCWSHRKFDLKRIPMKYRCPTCGKIVVKPEDRNPQKFRNYDLKTCEFTGFEWRPNKFEVTASQLLDGMLGTGGVCKDCWHAGLGKYGKTGKLFAWGMSKGFEKFSDEMNRLLDEREREKIT